MKAIVTKYLGATNTKPGRIVANCYAGRVVVEYDHRLGTQNNHRAAALALVDKFDMHFPFVPRGVWVAGDMPDGKSAVWVFVPDVMEMRSDTFRSDPVKTMIAAREAGQPSPAAIASDLG